METNNKMRDAVEKVRNLSLTWLGGGRINATGGFVNARSTLETIYEITREVLSAPPRNCDVGTAGEQIERWEKFCQAHHEYWKPSTSLTAIQRCNCPCLEGNGCNYFIWAQMPYTKNGDKNGNE